MKHTKLISRTALYSALAINPIFAQSFYGVGDLTGGDTWSQIRDVTKTGGVIYAVGSGTRTTGGPGGDTAIIWNSSSNTVTAIPYINSSNPGTPFSFMTASDITPDASYIAGRSLFNASGNARQAVRITTQGLTSTNLGVPSGFSASPGYAYSISDNGSILYGVTNNAGASQATRFAGDGSGATVIPFASVGDVISYPAARAISSDGKLMLGTSSTTGGGPGSRAFLYNDTNASITLLPLPAGDSWSQGLAMNSAGTRALILAGTSSDTNGALYLTDGTTNTLVGTPNPAWGWSFGSGISADGSIVGATWTDGTNSYGYIHNSNGWLDLYSLAADSGVNLNGWNSLNILGISEDGTLVWGDGSHNGNNEGFVLEFNSGYLAAVPEPATYAGLLGLGALGLALRRRRQTRAAD